MEKKRNKTNKCKYSINFIPTNSTGVNCLNLEKRCSMATIFEMSIKAPLLSKKPLKLGTRVVWKLVKKSRKSEGK
jgi:hypothetical protein